MADIIYTYKNEVYANITNKCDCSYYLIICWVRPYAIVMSHRL